MKWVTRERPKIDRIACPWLIRQFIDQEPEFLYVPAPTVNETARRTGAIPYDVPGVELTHVGWLCRFDAFLVINGFPIASPTLDFRHPQNPGNSTNDFERRSRKGAQALLRVRSADPGVLRIVASAGN